ncbi:hypothetical protein F0919_01945 [Taibaiella lutea]|uniref:Lipoprotein n=1 Tax=Taibaiella lutea TaxID=2608001 RepID=A0A5M6CR70_9BACT|nr:hypothetical protein [Taibaiella lutea]KAA5536452.1 hypothetical protein F0919_01945 [Taibaiella lutea]
MKNQIILISVFIILSFGCNNTSEIRHSSPKDSLANNNESKIPIKNDNLIDRESLFRHDGNLSFSPTGGNPENLVLVFYKFGNNSDTSWSLAAYKCDSTIFIKINEITPKNIAESFSMNYDTFAFKKYDGYSCKLSTSFWGNLINKIGLDSYQVKSSRRREVVGGRSYSLYYKSKVIVDSDDDMPYLKRVDSIFTKNIINKINYRAAHPPSKYDGDATH